MRTFKRLIWILSALLYIGGPSLYAAEQVLEGELEAIVEDYGTPAKGLTHSIERNFLKVGKERIELELPSDQKIRLRSKTRLRVRGQRTGKKIRLRSNRRADLEILQLSNGATPPVTMALQSNASGTLEDQTLLAAVTGGQKLAIVVVNFPNQTLPVTVGDVNNSFAALSNFLQQSSYGKMNLSGDIFGFYTLPSIPNGCDYATVDTEARQAAAAAGVNLNAYTHVMIIFPTLPCPFVGLGVLGGNTTWLNGRIGPALMAHELGHNFGLRHANSLSCAQGEIFNPAVGACTAAEYGDHYDTMGNNIDNASFMDYNAPEKEILGWLTAQTALTPGIYTINLLESAGSAVKALKVPLRHAGRNYTYYLEYHQNFINPNVLNGVLFHVPEIGSPGQTPTWALAMTGDFWNPALEVGGSYVDPYNNGTFTVLDRTPTQIRVQIGFEQIGPDQTPPAISFISPTTLATVSGIINITVSAGDNVGVTRVDYYLNASGVPFGSTTVSPYSFTWNTASLTNGRYTLTAKAYDAAGNVGTSFVQFDVSNEGRDPPTVSITAPLPGAIVSGTTNITVNAASKNGVISRVDYYLDTNTFLGSSSVSPYTFAWNTTTAANAFHFLTAKAYDTAGDSGESGLVFINVNNISDTDPTPPTVSLTSPSEGATVSGNTTLTASAQDNVGVIRVSYYLDDSFTPIGSSTTSPYAITWNSNTTWNGSHILTPRAYDAAGNVGRSAPVLIFVSNTGGPNTIPPTVSITAPANGTTLSGNTTLTASATDNLGVSRVDYHLDGSGTPLGSATVSPYEFVWNTTSAANGSHSLIAKAYDADGNSGVSTTILITLSNGGGGTPSVVLTKSSNVGSVLKGSPVTFTIQYRNTGTANATNVVITDVIPAGSTLVPGSITGTGSSMSGNTITWNIGTVNAGASVQNVNFTVTAQ